MPYSFTRKQDGQARSITDINELQAAIEDIDANGTEGGGTAITVQDEGSSLTTAASTLNFVGTGVTATGTGATKTISISSAAGSGQKLHYVVASNDAPAAFKALADYVCDGTADDVQIQAAIDAATAAVVGTSTGAGTVYLLPGRYYLSTGITGKSAWVIGSGYNLGVRLIWNGAAGATAWTQSGSAVGALTYGGVSGVLFTTGTASPGVWMDLTADGVDNGWRLENVQFGGGAVQLKIGTFVNAHFRNLRFDSWTDFALVATPGSTQTLATMSIDQFTWDHRGAGANGFFKLDLTTLGAAGGSSNGGTICFSHGRMESNAAFLGNKGIVEVVSPNPSDSRVFGIEFHNCTYQEVTATAATHSLIYSNTAATTIGLTVVLENFRQSGLDAILSGTLASGHPTIPVQTNYGHVAINTGGLDAVYGNVQVNSAKISSGTGAPSASDANGSIYLRTDGAANTTLYVRISGAWVAVSTP